MTQLATHFKFKVQTIPSSLGYMFYRTKFRQYEIVCIYVLPDQDPKQHRVKRQRQMKNMLS